MSSRKINLESAEEALELFGTQDVKLKEIEADFGVQIFLSQEGGSKHMKVQVRGPAGRVEKAVRFLRERIGEHRSLKAAPHALPHAGRAHPLDLPADAVLRAHAGEIVRPRTENQAKYVEAILHNDLVFGIGPAGTGKTYLAVACALRALEAGLVRRVILSRPLVEAGEKLGFLPGDILEKVSPYLRPLYDAFFSLLGPERFKRLRDTDVIEIVPLAYMRGRTFENSFIILDEAQNTTPEQMKMFLTRFGLGSKIVVTGDITQTDLGENAVSGLVRVAEILKEVEGVAFHRLTEKDIVRHALVKKIVQAYEEWEKKR